MSEIRTKDNEMYFQNRRWIPCEPEEWETIEPQERIGLVNTQNGAIYLYMKQDPTWSK